MVNESRQDEATANAFLRAAAGDTKKMQSLVSAAACASFSDYGGPWRVHGRVGDLD